MIELECIPIAAGHRTEGLCLLVRMGSYRVLLDCGLAELTPLFERSPGRPPADVVFCSHAHPDHAQGLRSLQECYPQIPIYASEVTTHLLALPGCRALPWRSPIEVLQGLSVELWPAGHLPGAAAFLFTSTATQRSYTVFFTGDFFLSNSRLVEGMPLDALRGLRPDVLILEGSYGTARYPHRRQQENQLAERIHQAITTGHSVILPAPALGLGQELLMLLRSHHHFTGQAIELWVDEAIAAGCDAYLDLLPHFPSSVQNFARHQPLFWDERIRPHLRRLPRPAEPELLPTPSILLMDQTAAVDQVLPRLPAPWSIFVPERPGWVDYTSPNRVIDSLVRSQSPLAAQWMRSQLKSRQLQVESYLLTDHCDGSGTTQLIHNLRPQHVIFVHGSPVYLADLTGLEELQHRYQLHCPDAGTVVELPIGETFIQPAPPDALYEGELTEHTHHIAIALSDAVTTDPRWARFADTGIVEARWQGEELVIRSLSQTELLQANPSLPPGVAIDCCEQCVHYRGQTCWNPVSALYEFKVSPDGFCPVFERSPQAGPS